jgi:PilZ domain
MNKSELFWKYGSGVNAPAPRLGILGRGLVRSMTSGEHPSRRLERRWAPRYSFRAELEIEWGSAVLRGKTRDISSNGMFIESTDTLWVGAGFTARLALDRPVQMDCSVKRVEPGQGMAVAVTVSGQPHQQAYQDLIASLTRPPA